MNTINIDEIGVIALSKSEEYEIVGGAVPVVVIIAVASYALGSFLAGVGIGLALGDSNSCGCSGGCTCCCCGE